MDWDKIIKINGNRIGILFFTGKDAVERAQAVLNSTDLNPFNSDIIQKGGIVAIVGLAEEN